MGFYFRKSFKCGPIRLNLSKSGIGASFGVKGLRYGIDAKGKEYIHAGRYGMYYRKQLIDNNKINNSKPKYTEKQSNRYQKEVLNLIVWIGACVLTIACLPNESIVETFIKVLIYLYPTGLSIKNKVFAFKILFVNLFFGWTILGYIAAFAWAIPKRYDMSRQLSKEDWVTIEQAQKLQNLYLEDASIINKFSCIESEKEIIIKYLSKDIKDIPDSVIELMCDIYKQVKILLKKELYIKAQNYYKNGDYELALETLRLIKAGNAEELRLRDDLKYSCCVKLNLYEEALVTAKDGWATNKREKVTYCYEHLEKYDEMISYLQSAFTETEKTNNPLYWAYLSSAFMKKGDIKQALVTALCGPVRKRAMNIEMAAFRYQLGLCYEALGDKKNAQKQFQKVYAFDVNYEDINEKLNKE